MISIKNREIIQHATTVTPALYIHYCDWKRFLASSANKLLLLIPCLLNGNAQSIAFIVGKILCHGNKCSKFTRTGGLPNLSPGGSRHKNLRANHATSTETNIVIRSPDTDVLVIGCTFTHHIPAQTICQTGTSNRRRCISTYDRLIGRSLREEVCQAFPGLHVFTGCDSTSAFFGQGRPHISISSRKAYGMPYNNLGASLQLLPSFSTCERILLIHHCYIPQTLDALSHHVKRAN